MAFPVRLASTDGITVSGTSHAITLPAAPPGDLLLVLFSIHNLGTCTPSAGWTKVGQLSGSTRPTAAVFWTIATGSDALTVTTSAARESSYVALQIRGGDDVTGSSAQALSNNANPPAHTAPESADYLWLATYTADGNGGMNPSAPPAGFTVSGFRTAGVTSTGAFSYVAERAEAGATKDPDPFTHVTVLTWLSFTLAVSPSPAAAGRRLEHKVAGTWVPQVIEKKVAGAWAPQIVERKDAGVWS